MGCFFYLIDYNLLKSNYYQNDLVNNPFPYWLTSSYAFVGIVDQSLWVKYCYCFYFSTSILSGIAYGDLVPQNPIETGYLCFILLLPLVIYSYIFNSIYDVISKQRERSIRIKKYLFVAKRYLQTLRVKKVLENKLITFLTYYFKNAQTNNNFINNLAPSVRRNYQDHTINAKFDFSIFQQMLFLSISTDRELFKNSLIGIII